jgi:MinD-like ATPase involved in chromosome partitioning or flagellar assembly
MSMKPQIVTFYSYKGGTGRTMTLANVAWILASNGKRVLAVDWDLEAPGLHRYFHPFLLDKECSSSPGVMDMVWDVSLSAMRPEGSDTGADWYSQYADVLSYAVSLRWAFPEKGTLDLLPAGRQGGSYAARVNSFSWKNFYERIGGGEFLDAVMKSMRAEYDYVLIDSRTGVSDTSGICTVQLPDTLVVCFTLNTQSIEGTAAVTESAIAQRGDRPLRILPVPMRLEDGEKNKLEVGLDYAYKRFSPFLGTMSLNEREIYFGSVSVPYKRFYAYEEVLAPFADRARQTQALLPTAEKLTSYISDGAVTALRPIPEGERRRWLSEFERGSDRDEPPLEQGLAALRDGNLELAKMCLLRAVEDADASGDRELRADACLQLSAVARREGDLESADNWYRQAVGGGSDLSSGQADAEAAKVLRLRLEAVVSRWEQYRERSALKIILARSEAVDDAITLARDATQIEREIAEKPLSPSERFEIAQALRPLTAASLRRPLQRALYAILTVAILSCVTATAAAVKAFVLPHSSVGEGISISVTAFCALIFFAAYLSFALLFYANGRARQKIDAVFSGESLSIE